MSKREKKIDDFIIFFENHKFDTTNVESYMGLVKNLRILRTLLGLVLILLALAIIILPIPGHLEIATIVYFTKDDGFTVSDLIALVILLSGILLLSNRKSTRHRIP